MPLLQYRAILIVVICGLYLTYVVYAIGFFHSPAPSRTHMKSLACRYRVSTITKMQKEKDEDMDRKEMILKQLAASDRPSGKTVEAPKDSAPPGAIPDYMYFFFPILGAFTAFAVQYFSKSQLPFG
ncbi:hypothetical protein GUITHDRAFT_99362 [Guillardia theta CCMP2712]|uniref:Transmembrane protein n=1 Tax=Guillardia theta (strain CCMP2712) TaxID=905079 RepID=L1K2L9_GUITC|nr:hypothetical protein GUITHDRAFT_99362 [Guillardia theta CCMP2712]EKX54705.1 hypothetical protein GUITHDRAFT_99362 [Guillardia theta CCMP2712]|eukprot:XP_005841685.1 hypothetical protein GUITHDRAFT_99362 [Guillardia theta CCMP2712]